MRLYPRHAPTKKPRRATASFSRGDSLCFLEVKKAQAQGT